MRNDVRFWCALVLVLVACESSNNGGDQKENEDGSVRQDDANASDRDGAVPSEDVSNVPWGATTRLRDCAVLSRIFGPSVFRVATHELFANGRVVARPETGQVRGDLHGALVRREQVEHERDRAVRNAWALAHSEEVLQA